MSTTITDWYLPKLLQHDSDALSSVRQLEMRRWCSQIVEWAITTRTRQSISTMRPPLFVSTQVPLAANSYGILLDTVLYQFLSLCVWQQRQFNSWRWFVACNGTIQKSEMRKTCPLLLSAVFGFRQFAPRIFWLKLWVTDMTSLDWFCLATRGRNLDMISNPDIEKLEVRFRERSSEANIWTYIFIYNILIVA